MLALKSNDTRPYMRPTSNPKHKHASSGFTLLELMIAILIFSILGGILTMVISTGSIFYSQENSQIDNQLDLTTFSFTMEKDIRQTLSLSTSNGCLILNQSGFNLSYCFNASTKTITRNGVALTHRVSSMTFTIFDNQLDIHIQSIPDYRGDVNTYTQHYVLREGNF